MMSRALINWVGLTATSMHEHRIGSLGVEVVGALLHASILLLYHSYGIMYRGTNILMINGSLIMVTINIRLVSKAQ